jgi:hypothetical protein
VLSCLIDQDTTFVFFANEVHFSANHLGITRVHCLHSYGLISTGTPHIATAQHTFRDGVARVGRLPAQQ